MFLEKTSISEQHDRYLPWQISKMSAREGKLAPIKISGGYNGEVTPVPIPNTEVKLSSAEDTWLGTARENMSSPDFYESLMVICHKAFVIFGLD